MAKKSTKAPNTAKKTGKGKGPSNKANPPKGGGGDTP